MKVSDIFDLPENVIQIVGRRGKIKNPEETKIVGMYEVVKIGDEFKGKIIVTYGHKRHYMKRLRTRKNKNERI